MPQASSQSNRQRTGSTTRNQRRRRGPAESVAEPKIRRRGRARCLRVDARPELRAEPDWDRFAWALLQYVRTQREDTDRQRSRNKGDAR